MRPLAFALLADENVHVEVVRSLRADRRDVATVQERGLSGASDEAVLAIAERERRVVLTHDRDFGGLATQAFRSTIGVLFVRPGHHDPAVVMRMLTALDETIEDVELPFVIVVERRGDVIRVRLRKPQ